RVILAEAASEIVVEHAALHVRSADLDEPGSGETDHAPAKRRLDLDVGVRLTLQPVERQFVEHPGRDGPAAQRTEGTREARDSEAVSEDDFRGKDLRDEGSEQRTPGHVVPDVAERDLGSPLILGDERDDATLTTGEMGLVAAE